MRKEKVEIEPNQILPEAAQEILKDAAKACKSVYSLSERESILNRAIRIVKMKYPDYFQKTKTSFDSIGFFVSGWKNDSN